MINETKNYNAFIFIHKHMYCSAWNTNKDLILILNYKIVINLLFDKVRHRDNWTLIAYRSWKYIIRFALALGNVNICTFYEGINHVLFRILNQYRYMSCLSYFVKKCYRYEKMHMPVLSEDRYIHVLDKIMIDVICKFKNLSSSSGMNKGRN